MFDIKVLETSHHVRSGVPLMFSEFIATFGLIAVIWGVVRSKHVDSVPYCVGGYITAAYWFTPSTSFANPAVTVARMLTDTFAGIRPNDAPGFIIAQLVGGAAASTLMRWLYKEIRR
jgi:glycerol uptake facilitator-like aquaporin